MEKNIRSSTIIDFAHGRLTPEESLSVINSLEADPRVSEQLDLVVDLMNEAANPRSELFAARGRRQTPSIVLTLRSILDPIRNHPMLFPAGALAAVASVFLVLISVNVLWTNKYDELTGIDRTAFTWNARGVDNSDIAGAYLAFTNGDYEKTLVLLDRYLRQAPRGDLAGYVHYTAGAVDLIASKHSYFAVLHIRDRDRVFEALQHLSLAISQTSNQRLLEESRFLRAKGYLMLGRGEAAIAELDTARALNGLRSEEAMQIIERIHALTP